MPLLDIARIASLRAERETYIGIRDAQTRLGNTADRAYWDAEINKISAQLETLTDITTER